MSRGRTGRGQALGDQDVVPGDHESLAVGQGVAGQRVIELIAGEDLARFEGLVSLGDQHVGEPHGQRPGGYHPQSGPERGRSPGRGQPGHDRLCGRGIGDRAPQPPAQNHGRPFHQIVARRGHGQGGNDGGDGQNGEPAVQKTRRPGPAEQRLEPAGSHGGVPDSLHHPFHGSPVVDDEDHVPQVERVGDGSQPAHGPARDPASEQAGGPGPEDQGEQQGEPDGAVEELAQHLPGPSGVGHPPGQAQALGDQNEQGRPGQPPPPGRAGPALQAISDGGARRQPDMGDGQSHADGEVVSHRRQPQRQRRSPVVAEPVGEEAEEEADQIQPGDHGGQAGRSGRAAATGQQGPGRAGQDGQERIEGDLGGQAPGLGHGADDVIGPVNMHQQNGGYGTADGTEGLGGEQDDDGQRHPESGVDPQPSAPQVLRDRAQGGAVDHRDGNRPEHQEAREHEEHRDSDVQAGQVAAEGGIEGGRGPEPDVVEEDGQRRHRPQPVQAGEADPGLRRRRWRRWRARSAQLAKAASHCSRLAGRNTALRSLVTPMVADDSSEYRCPG